MALKVGMKVKITEDQDGRNTKGKTGTIIRVNNDSMPYEVKFDTDFDSGCSSWWFPAHKVQSLYNISYIDIDTDDIVLPTLNY